MVDGPGVCDMNEGKVGLRRGGGQVEGSEENRQGKGGGSEEGEKIEVVDCGVVQTAGTSGRLEVGVAIGKCHAAG